MASQLERAHTYWSKLDIIAQTIILSELLPHFGSFQNVCAALKLQSNEVESFLSTHIEYQRAFEQGRLIAEQWGRDLAVPADHGDIPQQRATLLNPYSIVTACNFLEELGYYEHIQAVRAWSLRIITWPPLIDVTNLDTTRLDQADIEFPAPRQQMAYSRYSGSLGNDSRSIVGFVGAWRVKQDGSPDTRISFISVPEGSVAFGPRGSRELIYPGRYSVCWRTGSLADNDYHDFVLAKNAPDGYEEGIDRPTQAESKDYPDADEGWKTHLETLSADQGPAGADTTLPASSTINPKAIFGVSTPDTYNSEYKKTGLFHSRDAPQGPSKKFENPELQQMWNSWPGQVFQFRLPRSYTILGPLGHVLTFDPPEHETYDEMGNPHGIGGTYYIVPFQDTNRGSFRMDDLPANASFRLKTTENLVFIRNGMVLPGFIESGVHEWSVRDGQLDFYNARGCYNIYHLEGCYSILPGSHELAHHEYSGQGQIVAWNQSRNGEALQTLAPHREWLNRQEEQTKRLEREIQDRAQQHAQREAKSVREKAHRQLLMEERQSRHQALAAREAQEQARLDATVLEDTAIFQSVKNRRGRQKKEQQPIDLATAIGLDISVEDKATPRRVRHPCATRRKRVDDDEDEDYQPTTSRQARGRKPRSTQKPSTPRKSQAQPAIDIDDDIENPQSTPMPLNRRTRATTRMGNCGPESTDAGIGLPSAASARNPPRRAAPKRKPIGPLLEAIRGASATKGSGGRNFFSVPKVKDEEMTDAPDDDDEI